jgi:hypothetical protein
MSKYLSLQIERGGIDKPIFSIGAVYFEIYLDNTMRLADLKEYNPISIISEKVFSYRPKVPYNYIDSDGFTVINYGDFSETKWHNFWELNIDDFNLEQSVYTSETELLADFLKYYEELDNPIIICENVSYLDKRLEKPEYFSKIMDLDTIKSIILLGKNGKECLTRIIGENIYKPTLNSISLAKYNAWLFSRLINYLVN